MRAILIDPDKRAVRWVIDDSFALRRIHELLSRPGYDPVDCMDFCRWDDGHMVCLDDMGHAVDGNPIWWAPHYANPLAGRGLLMGITEDGRSVSPTLDINAVLHSIRWDDRVSAGDVRTIATETGVLLSPAIRDAQ